MITFHMCIAVLFAACFKTSSQHLFIRLIIIINNNKQDKEEEVKERREKKTPI